MAPKSEKSARDRLVEACLDTLRTVGPNVELEYVAPTGRQTPDGRLRARLGGRSRLFVVETTRTHISYALASGIIERARTSAKNLLLFAPYVPVEIGRHLAEHEVSYVDTVGNCHLVTKDGGLLVHVEGKRPTRSIDAKSGVRLPSYQLIFAILAQPDLVSQPIREIAAVAGVGKTTVSDQLRRLTRKGLVAKTRGKRVITDRRQLLERWLSAYPDIVRPGWLYGRFTTRTEKPEALEREIAKIWGQRRWAFGGGAAAWRMNRFYRGPSLVLHVDAVPTDELRRLRALPADDGMLTVLHTPGTAPYAGVRPHVAHPLLVYTEMITSLDPRLREAAERVRTQFLGEDS